ncbi:MAG: hypothetical protein M3015_14030 [Bacteroidota bacterium]|nr:hypothetical protein [Bacteroidota bacterium]
MDYKKLILICLFLAGLSQINAQSNNLPAVKCLFFRKESFNIVNFGGKADGVTLNTKSINDAISICNKKGGGGVVIPPGIWLTGPVVLKNSLYKRLARNAYCQYLFEQHDYKG